jgi:hypothetical protein
MLSLSGHPGTDGRDGASPRELLDGCVPGAPRSPPCHLPHRASDQPREPSADPLRPSTSPLAGGPPGGCLPVLSCCPGRFLGFVTRCAVKGIHRWNGTGVGSMIVGDEDRLLTPAEVTALFGVASEDGVSRDVQQAGRLGSVRTPGGHRRFSESEVQALHAQAEGRLVRRWPPLADRGSCQRPACAVAPGRGWSLSASRGDLQPFAPTERGRPHTRSRCVRIDPRIHGRSRSGSELTTAKFPTLSSPDVLLGARTERAVWGSRNLDVVDRSRCWPGRPAGRRCPTRQPRTWTSRRDSRGVGAGVFAEDHPLAVIPLGPNLLV